MDKSVNHGEDIADTIAYWRENHVRASEVLCSMGVFGNEWKQVGQVMKRWRNKVPEAERELHNMTWDETEHELTGR